jgi:hypothetical protein
MLHSFHYDMRQPEHDLGKPALALQQNPRPLHLAQLAKENGQIKKTALSPG